MIKDQKEIENLRKEWSGVRNIQAKIQRHLNVGSVGAIGGVGSTHELRNISHNLTLLFAFSVLEGALKQMHIEGMFKADNTRVGTLMYASQKVISWRNFSLVDQARKDRNKIAHDQEIFGREKCWSYLDAIEAELVAWQVVSAPIPFRH